MQRAGWLTLIATPLSLTGIVAACATGDEKVPPAPNTLCAAVATWQAKCGTPANACDNDIATSCAAFEAVMNTSALAAATSCLQGQTALVADRRGRWREFSPARAFDDAGYGQAAGAFDNPDFVNVGLHSPVATATRRVALSETRTSSA